MLDSTAPAGDTRPLYHRIANILRGEIDAGRRVAGERLPPIAALAATYAVAPVTVRQSLKLLSDEGLIRSRRGSGTFVAERPQRRKTPVLDLGWPLLPSLLRNHKGRILQADDSQPELLSTDGRPATAYRRMLRVHSDDAGEAYAVVEIFLARACYDLAPRRFNREMVLSLLEDLVGEDLPEMRQSFTLTAADAELAAHLGIHPGDPLGRLRRVLLNTEGEVVYYAITLSRADRVAFEWVLRRPEGTATPPAGGSYRGSSGAPAPGRASKPKARLQRRKPA